MNLRKDHYHTDSLQGDPSRREKKQEVYKLVHRERAGDRESTLEPETRVKNLAGATPPFNTLRSHSEKPLRPPTNPFWLVVRTGKNYKPFLHTTFSNGCLGSHNDEERSEMRYVMRIAESSESSNVRTHLALPGYSWEHAC